MALQNQGTALVTGASSGIGAVYADRLARRGFDLILVARNRERLEALARKLTDETGRSVEVVAADLSAKEGVARIEALLRTDASITMLVNNAGVGAAAPLIASDVDAMERMIDLNVGALTRLTYAAAPGFVARGGGPELLNGVYGASKAYVLALSQSLKHELADKGVRVQAVLPGATLTEFWDTAGLPIENLPSDWLMKATDLVDAALAGLDLGELVTIPALPDAGDWEAYEAARQKMMPNLSRQHPAARYSVSQAA